MRLLFESKMTKLAHARSRVVTVASEAVAVAVAVAEDDIAPIWRRTDFFNAKGGDENYYCLNGLLRDGSERTAQRDGYCASR